MHPQLELLLELQDMQSQRLALREEPLMDVEEEVFELHPAQAVEILDAKIEELTERLEPPIRKRYLEVAGSLDRAVAPVLNGICYGCFVATPTAWASGAARNESISFCAYCGRFLYYVD